MKQMKDLNKLGNGYKSAYFIFSIFLRAYIIYLKNTF